MLSCAYIPLNWLSDRHRNICYRTWGINTAAINYERYKNIRMKYSPSLMLPPFHCQFSPTLLIKYFLPTAAYTSFILITKYFIVNQHWKRGSSGWGLGPYSVHLSVQLTRILYIVITSFDRIHWPQNARVGCWIKEAQWHIIAENRCRCLSVVISRALFLCTCLVYEERLAYDMVIWMRVYTFFFRFLHIALPFYSCACVGLLLLVIFN
jgi:hypothetical protein